MTTELQILAELKKNNELLAQILRTLEGGEIESQSSLFDSLWELPEDSFSGGSEVLPQAKADFRKPTVSTAEWEEPPATQEEDG